MNKESRRIILAAVLGFVAGCLLMFIAGTLRPPV